MTDQPYETPTLTLLGTVAELTQGGQNGNFLDADFANNTPRGELTFS